MAMGSSLKLAVASATVLSTAVMINLLTPFVMNNTASIPDFRTVWMSLVSWLRPPYLYVVINCIIITIVASSRMQSKLDDLPQGQIYAEPRFAADSQFEPAAVKVVAPVEVEAIPQFHHQPEVVPFDGVKEVVVGGTGDRRFVDEVSEGDLRDEDMKVAMEAYEEITKKMADKFVISKSSWTPLEKSRVDLSFPVEKPPASARFSHRKPSKASPEGGRTLGVAKPKRQDTLETTWKTITEGRSVPLTRHLRKSDTWETHGQSRHVDGTRHPERMTKSDTFDVSHVGGGGGGRNKPPPPPSKLGRSGGSGRLKKEPSLGQEELNRRVEAFIRKFNEDMRLQRQESLNQYMEMINRGAH